MPDVVEAAARRRSEARAARDWGAADRLKAEIEAAGWRVVDVGLDYRLEPASPPSVEVGGEIRYGRSADVPSRLEDVPSGLATVVFLASPDLRSSARSLAALEETLPAGVDVVIVADNVEAPALAGDHEVVRTSAPLGRGAALNIGIRRATAPIIVALGPSVVATGDIVTPLVEALGDQAVAVTGPIGYGTADLRRFQVVIPTGTPVDVAAIEGGLMAFRRTDAAQRGPVDEGFRVEGYLDIWWSLVLRDTGEGRAPLRAVAVPNLPVDWVQPPQRSAAARGDQARLAKRNFYRVLDRFRTRLDLGVAPPEG